MDGHLKPLIIALIIDDWSHPSIKSVDKIIAMAFNLHFATSIFSYI